MATFLITRALNIDGVGYALAGRITDGIINAGDIAVIHDGDATFYLKILAVGNLKNSNPDWVYCALKISDTDKAKIDGVDILERNIEVFERRYLGADLDIFEEDVDFVDYIRRNILNGGI